jgi:RNA polymerase sigma factor FliA
MGNSIAVSNEKLIEIRNRLITGIEKLPAQERMVLSLYYVERLTGKEISMVLDIPEEEVKEIRSQALKKLPLKMRYERAN